MTSAYGSRDGLGALAHVTCAVENVANDKAMRRENMLGWYV